MQIDPWNGTLDDYLAKTTWKIKSETKLDTDRLVQLNLIGQKQTNNSPTDGYVAYHNGYIYWFDIYNVDPTILNNFLASFKFIVPAQATTLSWKDTVYNKFINLTDWKVQDNLSSWNFADYTYNDQRLALLKKYDSGKIVIFSKSFNEDGNSPTDDRQKVLEDSVKKVLSDNGWTAVAWPTEPGAYTDYLYVKGNHTLDYQVGNRDAVKGGLFVSVEFEY